MQKYLILCFTRFWQKKCIAYPLNRMSKCVPFYNLLRPITVDDCLETVKGSPTHHITNSFLLDAKALDLK